MITGTKYSENIVRDRLLYLMKPILRVLQWHPIAPPPPPMHFDTRRGKRGKTWHLVLDTRICGRERGGMLSIVRTLRVFAKYIQTPSLVYT